MTTTFEAIRDIIVRDFELPAERLARSTPLQEIELDSLAITELIFSLEDELHVTADNANIPFATLGDLADYVDGLIAAGAAAKTTAAPAKATTKRRPAAARPKKAAAKARPAAARPKKAGANARPAAAAPNKATQAMPRTAAVRQTKATAAKPPRAAGASKRARRSPASKPSARARTR
jgi:acyl carrier protein